LVDKNRRIFDYYWPLNTKKTRINSYRSYGWS